MLTATFMDYRGYTRTVIFGNSLDGSIDLQDGAGYEYVVAEGQPVYQYQYFIADAGGYSHLFQLTNLQNDGSTTGYAELTDVFSGTVYNILMGTGKKATKIIDGQTYYIDGTQSYLYIQVTWGSSAYYGSAGTENTVWPVISGKTGEKYAFAKNPTPVTILNSQLLVLPTGIVTANTWFSGGK